MNPAVSIVEKIIEQAKGLFDYLSARETEKTKREAINATKEVFIARIKAVTDMTMRGINVTFNERKRNFENLFFSLDKCLDAANEHRDEFGLKLVTELMETITALATDSPLKQLGSPYKQLGSPYKQLGSPYKQLGSPYKQLGSPYKQLGSPYKQLGEGDDEI